MRGAFVGPRLRWRALGGQHVFEVVVIGNGGHSRSCVDAWDYTSPFTPIGCTGRSADSRSELPYLGTDEALPGLRDRGVHHFFVAVGAGQVRERLTTHAGSLGFTPVPVVAPSAQVSRTATIGAGAAILHGSVVGAFASIGEGAIINTGATVDHDCVIGRYAHVAPGSHLAGNVTVGAHAFLGVGVSVIPGVTIGERAVVGAGAVVLTDVPADETVVGVPASPRPRKA
ncbi:MAG: acetyltransferase [Cellulomonas sp.]